jgi:hypothetical protein
VVILSRITGKEPLDFSRTAKPEASTVIQTTQKGPVLSIIEFNPFTTIHATLDPPSKHSESQPRAN